MSPPVRRRLVTGVALAVVLLESLGYYGARTSFLPYASERLGLPLANGSGLLGVASVAGLVAALMAGPIGASIGPLPTVALGLGLGAAGGTVLALADSAGGAGLGLVALVASPGLCLGPLYAALVREWGAGRPAGRVAVLLGAYGLLNVAALAAAPLSALVGRTSDNAVTAAPFFLVAGTGVVTAVVIAALAFAQRQPPRGPDDRRLPARGLLVNGLAVLLGAPTLVAGALAQDAQANALDWRAFGATWLVTLNPVAVVATCVIVALGLGAAEVARVRVPELAVAGVGAVVSAVGLGLGVVAHGSLAVACAAIVVGAVGEPLLWAGIVARAGGALHVRLATLAVCVVVASAKVAGVLSGFVGGSGEAEVLPGIVGVGSAVILGVAGISALLAAWPLQAWANEVASEVPAG